MVLVVLLALYHTHGAYASILPRLYELGILQLRQLVLTAYPLQHHLRHLRTPELPAALSAYRYNSPS